jgi:hypothetical protein
MSFEDLAPIGSILFWIVFLTGFFTYRIVRLIIRYRARAYALRLRLARYYADPTGSARNAAER